MGRPASFPPHRPWLGAAAVAAWALAVAAGLLRERLGEPGGVAWFGALAAGTLVLLVPGVLVAPTRGRPRAWLARRLSDFWLVAVAGMLTLHAYVLAVTGRPAWFYAGLLWEGSGRGWTGSGGLTPNLGLFVPVAGAMLGSMAVARLAVGRLRRVRLPGRAYAGAVAAAAAVSLAGASPGGGAAPGAGPGTAWERALPAMDGSGDAPPRDTVLVVMESLRADALDGETMPHAAALGRGGLTLTRHHAGANSSLLGLYGLLWGRPAAHAAEDLATAGVPPLLAAAQRAGFRTIWFCGAGHADGGSFGRLSGGFDHREAEPHDDWAQGDAWALGRVAAALAEPDRPPLFAVVFLVATHFDYPPPGAENGPFLPAAADAALLVPWTPGSAGQRAVLNRYRNAVHAADARLGRFLAGIDLATTRVAVTGDHGQALRDDGTIGHWSRLSDAQTRVPFVLAGPGVPRGEVAAPTCHADAAAVLLRAMRGLPIDPDPPRRPVLLVQSNPPGDAEDWVVLDGGGRTAWRRSGGAFERREPVPAPASGTLADALPAERR